jgi:predicted GNAT superfamily acetyltransferase
MSQAWRLVEPDAALVATLWARLAPQGDALLPAHFVSATFARMGGRMAIAANGALGLLFPRSLLLADGMRLPSSAGQNPQPKIQNPTRRQYTLRLHGQADLAELAALLAPDEFVLHDPRQTERLSYPASHMPAGEFDLGAPAQAELAAIRALHAAVWGDDASARYPADLFSAEFAPATALVARRDNQLLGFLLGFYRFGLAALEGLALPWRSDLAVESQVMAVAPAARRSGLAATLKRTQARQTLAAGLDLIHWTADPLQYANAALNFGRLRALAGEHYADYYPFRNALNRLPAARLGLIWLPRSAHGSRGLHDDPTPIGGSLTRFPGCVKLNDGPQPRAGSTDAPWIALEIPADWTALQHADLALATRWRATSDTLLARYLGFAPGRYLISDVAGESARRYLVARRFTPELLC